MKNGGVNYAWVPDTFISLIVVTPRGVRDTINSGHCKLGQHMHTATQYYAIATLCFCVCNSIVVAILSCDGQLKLGIVACWMHDVLDVQPATRLHFKLAGDSYEHCRRTALSQLLIVIYAAGGMSWPC